MRARVGADMIRTYFGRSPAHRARAARRLTALAACGLIAAGVKAVLVGETLMRASDPGAKLRELLGR